MIASHMYINQILNWSQNNAYQFAQDDDTVYEIVTDPMCFVTIRRIFRPAV